MPVSSDAQKALGLLEQVQKKVSNGNSGNSLASQVETDLELLTNLLNNPVLRNILKLEDSLQELNSHLQHHPSLLPTDFDINKSGQLVLNTNILPTVQNGKGKEGKQGSPSSTKQAAASSEKGNKLPPAFHQSIVQAAGKREIIFIQLNKPEGQSLGFSVVGLRSDHKGDLGIFIQEIQPNGIAGRDGRLAEGDQILAIDGQVLEAAISHQAAISILQRARGVVDLVVARGPSPEVPHIPLINLPLQQQQHSVGQHPEEFSPDSTRSRSSGSSHQSARPSSRSISPPPSPARAKPQIKSAPAGNNNNNHAPVDVVEVIASAGLSVNNAAANSLGRSNSALSNGSKTGGDMVLNTEWAQVEVVDLINDGSGLGFGIIGGRSTGVVVKTIVPGGVSDRDGRLQSGDHILQIGEVSLRGMGSEQVAAVLRQCGTHVRLVVARPFEPTSPDYQALSSTAAIVPTKVLGDPEELERHLAVHQNGAFPVGADPFAAVAVAAVATEAGVAVIPPLAVEGLDSRFIFTPPTLELPQSDVQLHVSPNGPHQAAVIQLTGTHLGATATEADFDVPVVSVMAPTLPVASTAAIATIATTSTQPIGQTLDLVATESSDYLPEVENFDVVLKKDSQGLGITIAGYVCEKEELSGIFVKSINPGSVADLSGRIQINDQIVEVDGQSLRGFNNHQAVEVLRNTGQIVKLTLARYLRGPKYDQLQQAMADSNMAASNMPPAVQSYRPPSPPPPAPLSPPPELPVEMATPIEGAFSHRRSDSIDAVSHVPQVPEPNNQFMDLDRFDPQANEPALDFSNLPVEELDRYIDQSYAAILSPECEAAIVAKWRRLVDDDVDIVVAQLSKFQPSGGLGISLEGTVDVEEGREVRPHHYIRSILPEGPVGMNGTLRSGDELLEVNGRKLLGLSHVEVVSILKDLPQSVRMVCARRQSLLLPTQLSRPIDPTQDRAAFASRNILGGSLQSLIPPGDRLVKAKSDGSLASTSVSPAADSPLSKSYRSRSLEPLSGLATWSSEPQIIELVKGDRGLGFSILDYQDPMNPNETIIVIRSLVPGGVAQQDGRLIPGDRLLFVNDINLENASLDEAVQVLKGAPKGVVQIGVAKPHPVSLNENNAATVEEPQRGDEDGSASSDRNSDDEYYGVQDQQDAQVKVPPPLPQTAPPPLLDFDSESPESEPPNPLLVPVATERLLGSATSGSAQSDSPDATPLPTALERSIRIKKGGDPLGINVEVVDGGASGVVITSIAKGGAIHRDGRLRPGDYLVSVNHESMRFATNAQARAILRRTQLISTDVSIVYIPGSDAAIHRQTALLMQLAQDPDTPAHPASSSSPTSTVAAPVSPPPSAFADIPPVKAPADFDDHEKQEETSNHEEDDQSSASMRITQPTVVAKNGNNSSTVLSRNWGPERTVPVERDPTKSLGISIVGGKVDVASGSGAPISGIFIKNVLPDSPAGRTGQLKTGDRILAVDGEDLREASHERAVEVIRKAGNPVTFLVQSLVDWEPQAKSQLTVPRTNGPGSVSATSGTSTPNTEVESLTPLPNGTVSPTMELPKVAPPPPEESTAPTPTPEVIQAGVEKKPVEEEEDDDEEDDGDTQGRTYSANGQEMDRSSAGCIKLTASERAADSETPDEFGYTTKKIHKKWGDLKGELVRVDLDRSAPGGGQLSNTSLGLSLAGHRDRNVMAVYICGLNPNGIAYKDGRLQVGDELVEVNGNVVFGRCHLNASAIIKGIGGAIVTIIAIRREGALQDVAVPPITRFPISLEEQPPEEKYARFKNLRIITLKKGPAGLGIMIIEGRHAEVGKGIFISDIQSESVAEQAGLAVGDMILCVNKDELLGADYDTAASVLKKSEGILTIVVCNPKDKKAAEEKPKIPPKPAIAPKPATVPPARFLQSHNASTTSLPLSSSGLDVSLHQMSSQSAPQSPLNASSSANASSSKPYYSPSQSPSLSAGMPAAISATSLDAAVNSETLPVIATNSTTTPVDAPPSLSNSSSSSSFMHGGLAGRAGPGSTQSKESASSQSAPHQGKAVLRQHGGPSTHSKSSVGGNLAPKVEEPPQDPATCEVKPGKETTIEINKDKLGLGLSIVGGSDTLLGAILIHEVYPDGAAARDKRLKPGDQILEVNGESFRNITHSRALAVLRQTPAKVKMMVYRDETSLKDDDMLDIIEVELLKKPGRGLGLSIVGRRNGPGVYISDVVKGGAAEADGRLMQGDQILTVNGTDLRTASQEQAAAILKTAMGKIDLKVGRLKAGAASPRSATSAESSPAPTHSLPPAPPVREDSLPPGLNQSNLSTSSEPPLIPTPTTPPPPPIPVLPQPFVPNDPPSSSGIVPTSIPPPTYSRIVLERGADGLGFSIVGGRGSPQGDLPIFVKTVFERGAAANSPLRPGDQIHAVDSVLLEGKTHQEAVALLKNAKGNVTLTIVS